MCKPAKKHKHKISLENLESKLSEILDAKFKLIEIYSTEIEEDINCIGIAGNDNIYHFPKQNLI